MQNQRNLSAFMGNTTKIPGEKDLIRPDDFVSGRGGCFWLPATHLGVC